MIDNTDFSTDFMKYRGPTATTTMNSSTYPSYSDLEQPSSWLRGTDFTSLAGDLFSSTTAAPPKENEISYGNLSNLNLNLDQIKIVKKKLNGFFILLVFFRVTIRWRMF